MIYLQLFFSFLQVGALSFGGGYAAMPLIQEQVVNLHGWLSMNAFTDLVTIAEMTPGPIAVNAATFVGMQIIGPLGAVVATLGCILPSCVMVTLLAHLYTKYQNVSVFQGTLASLRPAVVAMIASAGIGILLMALFGTSALPSIHLSSIRVIELCIFTVCFILLRLKKAGPIQIIFLSAVVGTVVYSFF